jgi:hypothetical protein
VQVRAGRLAVEAGVEVGLAAAEDERVGAREVQSGLLAGERPHAGARLLEPRLVGRRVLVAEEQQDGRAVLVGPGAPVGVEERLPRAGDALTRRVLGQVEQLPDLAQRQPGLEAQQEHEALVRAQLGQRAAQQRVAVGRVGCRRGLVGQRPLVAAPAAAQLVEREVGGGAVQPRPHDRRLGTPRPTPPGAHERLLAQVLRRRVVADHARQAPRDRSGLLVDDRVEVHLTP